MISSRHPRRQPLHVATPPAFPRFTNFQSLTNYLSLASHFVPISFQSLTTVKFSKSFPLITIRNAGGVGVRPATSSVFQLLPASIIPFVFTSLRTLLRHGRKATLLESDPCALFPSPWGCVRVPPSARNATIFCSSSLPYVLPSSVCAKSFVSHSYENCRVYPLSSQNGTLWETGTKNDRSTAEVVRGCAGEAGGIQCKQMYSGG